MIVKLNNIIITSTITNIYLIWFSFKGSCTYSSCHYNYSFSFQNKLQEDFDTVQAMLEEKQKDIDMLTKDLEETRSLGDGMSGEMQVRNTD